MYTYTKTRIDCYIKMASHKGIIKQKKKKSCSWIWCKQFINPKFDEIRKLLEK